MRPLLTGFAFCAVATSAIVTPVTAAAADPAAARIETLYASLLEAMKSGKGVSVERRAERLKPVIDQTFNFTAMSQFAVGSKWATMSEVDRKSVVDALDRYTVRSYANNFDTYSGEVLNVLPDVASRGPDKLVKTTITQKTAAPTALNYRMREYDGKWKVIDVYFNAVSQVTAQRADFASSLDAGGAPALVRKLDKLTQTLR